MGRARWGQRKTALLIGVAVVAAGIGVVAYATHLLRRSELQTIDARFSIRGKQAPPSDVVLVGIDGHVLQELRNRQLPSQFPFPRRYDAEAIDHLRRAGAKVIVLDIEFTHPTRQRTRRRRAVRSDRTERTGKPCLGRSKSHTSGRTEVLGGPEHLREAGARAADVGCPEDSDGSIRRFDYAYNGLHSFAVVASELANRPSRPGLAIRRRNAADRLRRTGRNDQVDPLLRSSRGQFSPSAVRGRS